MFVNVNFYAQLREIANLNHIKLELNQGSNGEDIIAELVKMFPPIKELAPYLQMAINEEFIDLQMAIDPNAEVAILPPVSGG